ncbi:TIGR01777 family oxidoreductase [Lysinibacillus xylanilyticus]|uniref:TIGR01777 family oxidoreductase n=1 Tax=Lysinibacillus xylanilyticus TaxID=582475 RepID=A0ABT4EN15_9BACI|nr:TIGR01777 family oxidoreductase [Lysinibacillus xylanilyticus]MCY9547052.1 TIGR01777 family oxidoreductase [Lysinibacillus xylanilyticus]MED3801159.1 TIGR01777 family oxidoreductase [Lysinibacillus xylanilyticus]
MKIVIAGGTGFVGKALTKLLQYKGHEIIILTRNKTRLENDIQYVQWLQRGARPEQLLHEVDAIVNLAGISLNNGRWTKKQKKAIYTSRMDATLEIVRIMEHLNSKPKVLVNASAVGVYPTSTSSIYTENSTDYATDFLGSTVYDWERRAVRAEKLGVRVTLARFGVILGRESGALPSMLLPYKLHIGGTIGSGEQWLSWVHVEDVARAIYFAITNDDMKGPFNVTAPNATRMKNFGKTIASIMERRHWMPVPSFVMRLALGEQSMLVLEGQHVLPTDLEKHHFTFKFPHLKEALQDLLV